jgi:hypothetical protein
MPATQSTAARKLNAEPDRPRLLHARTAMRKDVASEPSRALALPEQRVLSGQPRKARSVRSRAGH